MEDSPRSNGTQLCCSSILDASREGHDNCIQQLTGRDVRSRTSEINLEAVNVHSVLYSSRSTSPLQLSARRGHVECVDLLIDAGADVNWKDSKGDTALHHAASGKADDERAACCARSLIAAGANVSVKNYFQDTALHVAALHESVEVMKVLLSAKCDLEEKTLYGCTALHCANMSWQTKKKQECVRLLLAHGASVNARNNHRWTPLYYALCVSSDYIGGNIEDAIGVVRQLLEAGTDITMCGDSVDLIERVCSHVHITEVCTKSVDSAHHDLGKNTPTALLELLIVHGVSLERTNEGDKRYLMSICSKAVGHCTRDFLICLLNVPGLKPWMMTTLLKEAVTSVLDGPDKLRILLDAGASAKTGYDGRLALMSCAQSLPSTPQLHNSVEMFNILVSNGAQPCLAPEGCVLDHRVEGVCLCGQNMLHTAVQNGNVALVEAILKTGVDASLPCDHMTDSASRYPLITALNVSEVHGPSLVQLLLSYGADIMTVLQPANESSTPSFVKELCPHLIDTGAIMSILALLPIVPLRCCKHQRIECCEALGKLISSPPSLQECCRATICSSSRSFRRLHRQGLLEVVRSLPIPNIVKDFLLAPFGLRIKSMLTDQGIVPELA